MRSLAILPSRRKGVGAIGMSGNVGPPEDGARIYLSSVITDAPLEPDQPLDENPCDECKTCLNSCPARFMSFDERVTFTMGGREITHIKKGIHARCAISCMGLTGLSRDGKWSTWAPAGPPIPEDDEELVKLLFDLIARYFQRRNEHPELPNFARFHSPMPGYPEDKQGILPRNKFDTQAVTCGNCAIVCLETKPKRAKALKALHSSGVVVEDEDGKIQVKRPEQVGK